MVSELRLQQLDIFLNIVLLVVVGLYVVSPGCLKIGDSGKGLAIMDIRVIADKSTLIKGIQEEVAAKKKELEEKSKPLDAEIAAAAKKAEAAPKKEKEAAKKEFLKVREEVTKKARALQMEFQKFQEEKMSAMNKRLDEVAVKVAKDLGYKTLMARVHVKMGGEDITDQILEAYDK